MQNKTDIKNRIAAALTAAFIIITSLFILAVPVKAIDYPDYETNTYPYYVLIQNSDDPGYYIYMYTNIPFYYITFDHNGDTLTSFAPLCNSSDYNSSFKLYKVTYINSVYNNTQNYNYNYVAPYYTHMNSWYTDFNLIDTNHNIYGCNWNDKTIGTNVIYSSTPPAPTQYTVTFNTNGGSSVAAVDSVLFPIVTAPTKTGYTFGGWYYDEELTEPATRGDELIADCTVYAKWNIIQYSVQFFLPNGVTSANTNDATVDYGSSYSFSFNYDNDYTLFVSSGGNRILPVNNIYTISNVTQNLLIFVELRDADGGIIHTIQTHYGLSVPYSTYFTTYVNGNICNNTYYGSIVADSNVNLVLVPVDGQDITNGYMFLNGTRVYPIINNDFGYLTYNFSIQEYTQISFNYNVSHGGSGIQIPIDSDNEVYYDYSGGAASDIITGLFGAVLMFWSTVGNGIVIGGLSVANIVYTLIVIAVIGIILKVALK